MKVAIYTRVSTDHQIDKDSLPMQRRDLIAYAKLVIGTEDYEIFEDAGYSGKNVARPSFQAMMTRVRNKEFTHVLVWKIDRISRNLLDFAQMYAELKKLGVAFVSKNEQFDTSSAMGEAMLKIILVFAELERNMTSERVTATMISRASKGIWNGGHVPYGYSYNSEEKAFEIVDSEAKVIHLMHDQYEQMRSLIRLANDLTARGYRTRNDIPWSPSALAHILGSNFYCGDYQYNVHAETNHAKLKPEKEWVCVKDHHPAIISREQKARINDMLAYNDRGKKVGRRGYVVSHAHIFGGIVHCHTCGRLLHAATSHNAAGLEITVYNCPTKRSNSGKCNQKSLRDFALGDFLFNYIANMIRVQNKYKHCKDPATIERDLLSGWPFTEVKRLSPESLTALCELLAFGSDKELFLRPVKSRVKSSASLATLQRKKAAQDRAMQRLTELYLYSDNEMSAREFVTRKADIEEKLTALNKQIKKASPGGITPDDANFIETAGKFILYQELRTNGSISFKTVMENVGRDILHDFVQRIVSNIIVDGDNVLEIHFRNGLIQIFEY